MQENPFSDSVPTHFAIAATVYTKPLTELSDTTKSNKSKLILVTGGYGNGKSHALERLKNDLNINEKKKLAIYCSAFATKSLQTIYEQVCSELSSGKLNKFAYTTDGRAFMTNKGIPSKIIDIFYNKEAIRPAEDIKANFTYGKIVASSSDVIHFFCALSLLVDQFVLLMDDIEEATTMEQNERKMFFGHIRALYDEAVRKELSMIVVMTLTLDKLELLKNDRMDLYERMDKVIKFDKLSPKEFENIIEKRLEISALDDIKVDKSVIKQIWGYSDNIRGMLNILRDLLEEVYNKGEKKITTVVLPEKTVSQLIESQKIRDSYKPADDLILNILESEDGLSAEAIIERSKKSGSWIRHRLADLVNDGVLLKEQVARNRPAKYILSKVEKKQ
ncbi:MAG: P-loop NTPase fold protein [archaeon]